MPHFGEAVRNLEPLHGGLLANWNGFVGVVLALSGVEAIANATGVMKLDPGSTQDKPSVAKTSTPAIIWVMIEVCVFTALLSLATHALNGLELNKGDVDAPDHPGVRDYMLRYMAEIFVGGTFGSTAGQIAAWAVSIVFGVLLLSAVNTSIVGLIAIIFLMSRDREVPRQFQKLNAFGVPTLGMIVATAIPWILVLAVRNVSGLADLYAVGVVGAIATNLGATSTDKKLRLATWERALMFCTFLVMAAIEISLVIDKPNARNFAATTLAVGLILRGLAREKAREGEETEGVARAPAKQDNDQVPTATGEIATELPLLCAVRTIGRTLDFAIEEARAIRQPLYVLFIRQQPALTIKDRNRAWHEDKEAHKIFTYAKRKAKEHPVVPCYVVSDAPADTIVDVAATVGASRLILGSPQRSALVNVLRGNLIRKVSKLLPKSIHLLVYA